MRSCQHGEAGTLGWVLQPSCHLVQFAGARAYSGRGRAGNQPAGHTGGKQGQGGPFPAPVPGPFLSEGQQEVRDKGLGWEVRAGGRDGVYQVAGGLPQGQELARVTLARDLPREGGGADLLGRRTPTQVSPRQTTGLHSLVHGAPSLSSQAPARGMGWPSRPGPFGELRTPGKRI